MRKPLDRQTAGTLDIFVELKETLVKCEASISQFLLCTHQLLHQVPEFAKISEKWYWIVIIQHFLKL